jgi:putative ABC transport system permease protein
MGDARRERIRKALVQYRLRLTATSPGALLTRERLQALGALNHVESVVPVVHLFGWAAFNGQSETAEAVSARRDDPAVRDRLEVGRFFAGPDESAALVSEFLLYRWGVRDDADMQAALGQKVRLEIRSERPGAGLGVWLFKGDGTPTTREETAALDKIKRQLPAALDKLDLAPEERSALRNALREAPPRTTDVFAEEFTIVGVLRLPTDAEQRGPFDVLHADVVLPVQTAENLFFRAPAQGDRGLDRALVYVDREEHVKEVLGEIRQMGLNGFGALEFIERERLMYLLIFGAMTCVAGVAMVVAAIGIANTMLMSVLERTHEIGIMKAVGANNGHVQLIFLVEGLLIGLVGGGLGLLLSWGASFPGDAYLRSLVSRDLKIELKEAVFVFPAWLVAAVLFFAVLVTTLAAVYPARRATKVNPVTALRHE